MISFMDVSTKQPLIILTRFLKKNNLGGNLMPQPESGLWDRKKGNSLHVMLKVLVIFWFSAHSKKKITSQ